MAKAVTSATYINTAERRAFVLDKRKSGMNYRDIAQAAIDEFGADNLPAGFDERYAYKDVKRELDRLIEELRESASDVLTIDLQRLDVMLSRLWEKVDSEEPDYAAVDRVLKLMERRAKLLGMDAPQQLNALIRNINLGQLTDEQLTRIAEGEDLLYVIANPSAG